MSVIRQIFESGFLIITYSFPVFPNSFFLIMKDLEAQWFVHCYSRGALEQHVINIPMLTSDLDYCLSSFMIGEKIFGTK